MSKAFKKIEIELSSRCNAACPGCLRTILINQSQPFEETNLCPTVLFNSLEGVDLSDTEIKLCGVLGDPMAHPDLLTICERFVALGGSVEISTNGSLGRDSDWQALGKMSQKSKKLRVHFSVDGLEETNSVYRKNTRFDKIETNIWTYTQFGGKGVWVFIDFDHNTHQKNEVRDRAKAVGLEFAVRRAIRNSFPKLKHGKNESVKVDRSARAHDALAKFRRQAKEDASKLDGQSILCKYKHGNELFISAEGGLWPCCFLWDEFRSKRSTFFESVSSRCGHSGWNSLKNQRLSEVLDHPFFTEIQDLWDNQSNQFTRRCFKSCGSRGDFQNTLGRE